MTTQKRQEILQKCIDKVVSDAEREFEIAQLRCPEVAMWVHRAQVLNRGCIARGTRIQRTRTHRARGTECIPIQSKEGWKKMYKEVHTIYLKHKKRLQKLGVSDEVIDVLLVKFVCWKTFLTDCANLVGVALNR